MQTYIRLSDSFYPFGEYSIRQMHPASYPTPFVPPAEYAPVLVTPPPPYNSITHRAVELAPAVNALGNYEQRWEIVALLPEVVDANIVDAGRRLQADIVAATQARLDDFARTRNYDGILSAATYAFSAVPRFQAEGQYAVDARDSTWDALYTILAEVLAGTRPAPASFADIEPDLPVLEWPAA